MTRPTRQFLSLVIAAVLFLGVIAWLLAAPGAGGQSFGTAEATGHSSDPWPGMDVPAAVPSDGVVRALAAPSPSLEDDGGGIAGTPPPTDTFSLASGRTGVIAQAVGHGSAYLAIPIGPGKLVTICAVRCWTTVSTDAGPTHDMLVAGRIADVALGHWRYICGLPAVRGTCRGSWRLVAKAGPTLPPTDSDGR